MKLLLQMTHEYLALFPNYLTIILPDAPASNGETVHHVGRYDCTITREVGRRHDPSGDHKPCTPPPFSSPFTRSILYFSNVSHNIESASFNSNSLLKHFNMPR